MKQLFCLISLVCVAAPVSWSQPLRYPEAPAQMGVESHFGIPVRDPYRWLENGKSPEVMKWSASENKLTRSVLDAIPVRKKLVKRFHELYYRNLEGIPYARGGRIFNWKQAKTQEKEVYYWKASESGTEKVLLDLNSLPAHTGMGDLEVSQDGKKVAYTTTLDDSDEGTLHVRDVETGMELKSDKLSGLKYSTFAWSPSNKGIFYTYYPTGIPEEDRPAQSEVRYHRLGSAQSKDVVVFPKVGKSGWLSASESRDRRWLFVNVSTNEESKVYARDLKAKGSAFTLVSSLEQPVSSSFWGTHGYVYQFTNNQAPHSTLLRVPYDRFLGAKAADWETVIPEDKNANLTDYAIWGDRLFFSQTENVTSKLKTADLSGKHVQEIELPGLGIASVPSAQEDETIGYYTFESLVYRHRTYRLNSKDLRSKLVKESNIPVDTSAFQMEQVWFPSRDGTKIPMFIVTSKKSVRDGKTPFLLYGYGGFDVPIFPNFNGAVYPWLEAGGGYALVNLRGGSEFGEDWHRAGMGSNKQNVFDDAIAAAEYLINRGYTRPEKLAINGESNGGLLVGAVITQRPDLFGAAICGVPLLDMIRFPLFGAAAKSWITEYGDPATKSGFFQLFSYSPYHHVRNDVQYPATLFMSSASDDRVDPLHARKMLAAMQAGTSTKPILMRLEANAGHGGGSGNSAEVEYDADKFAFLMSQLGM